MTTATDRQEFGYALHKGEDYYLCERHEVLNFELFKKITLGNHTTAIELVNLPRVKALFETHHVPRRTNSLLAIRES